MQLKIAFSLNLTAFEYMHLCAGNTRCDPTTLKLNLSLRVLDTPTSNKTVLYVPEVCFPLLTTLQTKKHSGIDANKCHCTAVPQKDTAASTCSILLNNKNGATRYRHSIKLKIYNTVQDNTAVAGTASRLLQKFDSPAFRLRKAKPTAAPALRGALVPG